MTKHQYEQLIDRYRHPIRILVYRMIWEWDAAEDLTQEVFVKLWERHQQIALTSSIYTLIYRIAVHSAIDYLRSRKATFPPDTVTGNTDIAREAEQTNLLNIIERCARHLKPKQRAVFLMRDVEGFTIEEIALIMDVSAGNVRSNLHLARKNIREELVQKFNITEESLYDL